MATFLLAGLLAVAAWAPLCRGAPNATACGWIWADWVDSVEDIERSRWPEPDVAGIAGSWADSVSEDEGSRSPEQSSRPTERLNYADLDDYGSVNALPPIPLRRYPRWGEESSPTAPSSGDDSVQESEDESAVDMEDLVENLQVALQDKYQFTGLLGHGSFGRVYEATDRRSGKRVAIKFAFSDPDDLGQNQEYDLQRKVHHHRNVLTVHEAFDMLGGLVSCIVMDVADSDLFDHVKECGALDEEEARSLFVQLVDAVDACHEAKIVHHDIKPQNVLLACDRTRVLLSDFGLAGCPCDDNPALEILTSTSGTRTYMPPEKINEKLYWGPPSDVWSLGCVLFVMLSGHQPFRVGDDAAIRAGNYYPLPDHVSGQAKDLIDWILQPVAANRPTIDDIRGHVWTTGRAAVDAPRYTRKRRMSYVEHDPVLVKSASDTRASDAQSSSAHRVIGH
ncbi:Protein kinase domain-containing protein [Plasmodiophora brassicae]